MIRALAFIGIYVIFSCAAAGQSKEELQQQKQKAYDEIKLARELMEKTAAQRTSTVKQIRILQKGINARAGLISTLQNEVELTNRNISNTEASTRIEMAPRKSLSPRVPSRKLIAQ